MIEILDAGGDLASRWTELEPEDFYEICKILKSCGLREADIRKLKPLLSMTYYSQHQNLLRVLEEAGEQSSRRNRTEWLTWITGQVAPN